MCGIAGVVGMSNGERVFASLMSDLRHRGPDSGRVCRVGGCTLGVRRLAVRGARAPNPVRFAESGRVVALNGEIYRWPPVAGAGARFPVGPVDEVRAYLAARQQALAVDGMYAIADISPAAARLVLARDTFGIKPLFWCRDGDALLLASETRALRRATDRRPPISQAAIDDLLAFGRVVGCDSIYRPIRSVPRGVALSFDLTDIAAAPAALQHDDCEDVEHVDLRQALRQSLEACLYTQRPLGLALSGGLDSSILAWELNALGVEGVTTISVHVANQRDGVFALEELDLPPRGAWTTWRHVNVRVDPRDFFDLFVESVEALDAPHRMTSAPLTIALARAAAREGIVVLLTGEGVDELYFGYGSHRRFFDAVSSGDDVLSALVDFACPRDRRTLLRTLLSRQRLEATLARLRQRFAQLQHARPTDALRELEAEISLEPLLLRTDHCLMRYGIEGRMPFLHGDVPRLARKLARPGSVGREKPAIREAWADVLPQRLVERPKVAFRAPLANWAADREIEWLEALIVEESDALSTLGVTVRPWSLARRRSSEWLPTAFALAALVVWSRMEPWDRASD